MSLKMKIHICGTYGTGKSTLAKILGEKFNIKYYSLDNIKYLVKYSKIRSVEDRIKRVKQISRMKNWITEGSWSDYAEDLFKNADLIILVKINKLISSFRIIKRQLNRDKQEKDNLFEAVKLVIESYKYYLTKNNVSLHSHKEIIKKHKKKYMVLKRKKDIPEIVRYIKNNINN